MKNKSWIIFQVCLIIFSSCGSPSESEETYLPDGLDRREKLRYEQYLILGKQLYLTQCANCHQQDGTGLKKLYPPLAKSDYLLADIPRAACIIKYGQKEQITVNGQLYTMPMPALSKLTPIEIAQILTYIGNSWGNQHGFVQVKDVERFLQDCESN